MPVISSVERWDEWFENVGDELANREWKAAKSVHSETDKLNGWAFIIEMNRLDRLIAKKEPDIASR